MSQLSKKISELEKSRRRKSTIQYLTSALIILGAFVTYYIITFDNQVKSEETIEANLKTIEEKRGKLIAEEKRANEEQGNIQQIYSTNRHYLEEIQQAIEELKSSEKNPKKRAKIESISSKVNNLHKFNSDEVTIVFESVEMNMIPYTQPEDSIGNFASQVLAQIETQDGPSMNVVPKKPNTLYYGSLITTSYIDSLGKDLMSKGIKIEYIAPFKNDENTYRNEKSIQLLYVDYDSIGTKNDNFHIRMYSYNSDSANKKIIENTLANQKYNFQVFPDWVKKPSFFSDVPTVVYYDENAKKEADELAKILSDDLPDGVDFVTRIGSGYGVSDKEKRTLLVIHYLPNK